MAFLYAVLNYFAEVSPTLVRASHLEGGTAPEL